MRPDDAARLWDMCEAARRLISLLDGITRARFDQDDLVQLSVERLLLNIGEAARRITQETRDAHPEIPWAQIVGQRNVLVHEYGDVNPALVWLTASRDVPDLLSKLEAIMPPEPEE
jgi:uncharacterized protein with HEPN domain